ncbi:radical SAM protein [Clostridium chauvoei]|uniref:radical SAM protein n=1 Tax=Clostridium chauvoei TaxID=46867 RepID=UPI001C85F46F|nr:radical SAM protein [Clostridium chauvoei]MBX7371575.1 radical SAM protein [Clostridium chauvoei]MBX7374085.1 radical SAM protein [Clostridium chauvoei]MBX7386686.1 radical SAM protein [Clostridium chauvoei]MBX7421930.1 radical SAM protein [Clostridium chauvoei]
MKSIELLNNCKLCIRGCSVNRNLGERGYCNCDNTLKVAKAYLHQWEEPCISGKNGSGTVFFSNCNLKCIFCQNHTISNKGFGKEISIERLSKIFLELQEKGAHNINLVTPTHYVPQIIQALDLAKANGLKLPIVYNTNGTDSLDTIKALNGYIDIYLPDFKYFDDKYAKKYSKIDNYSNNLLIILEEMLKQVVEATFDENGLIKKGVIIRHLMLPGLLFDSKKIIDSIYNKFKDKVFISLMNQYTPMFNSEKYPEINKQLNPKHYDSLVDYAVTIGVKNGFIQDTGTNSISFVPDFNNEGV